MDVQINVLVPGEARTEMNQGSNRSPYTIAGMVLLLLSHSPGGPNGHFFHADGRHLAFGYSPPYDRSLLTDLPPVGRRPAFLAIVLLSVVLAIGLLTVTGLLASF